jgi:hypothetical protein
MVALERDLEGAEMLELYRKKPLEAMAGQWNKPGDLPGIVTERIVEKLGDVCPRCGEDFGRNHGWIRTHSGGHIVCAGDWVVKDLHGEFYPCKKEIFEKTYERVSDV